MTSSTDKQNSQLRAIREGKGLTLAQVAAASGVDIGHLSRIERGESGLSIDTLARLAAVLEMGDLAKRLAPFRRRGGDAIANDGAPTRKPRRVN